MLVTTPDALIHAEMQRLQEFVRKTTEIMALAAERSSEVVQNRVENDGTATNGSTLMTKSKQPIGRYGQRHGGARILRGLQVNTVDLHFTGEMWRTWKVEPISNGAGVGFETAESIEKADNLQNTIYGTVIFTPSDNEMQSSINPFIEEEAQKLITE